MASVPEHGMHVARSFFVGLFVSTTLLAQTDPMAVLDSLLPEVVENERVDYAVVARRYKESIDAVLDLSAQIDPDGLREKDRLAFYINLYNAAMVQAVLDRGGVDFRPDRDDFKVFKDPLVRLKTGNVSLNDLENNIIRKQFKDPRIHAALVCGAISCPPLINKAYRGETLDKQLDENVKNWLADPKRNIIDDAGRTLKLSKIFDWYADDFGGKANVAKWVSEKLGRDVSGYGVEFLEYDWSLNKP